MTPFFLIVVLQGIGWTAGFSADIVDVSADLTLRGTIRVMDLKYRLDLKENGADVSVIVDRLKKTVFILNHTEKKYLNFRADDPRSLGYDPFLAAGNLAGQNETRFKGSGKVNGFRCDKKVTFDQGHHVLTQWIARDLFFPLRIVLHGEKSDETLELVNIREEYPPASLFSVSQEYVLREDPLVAAEREQAESAALEREIPLLTTPQIQTVNQENEFNLIEQERDGDRGDSTLKDIAAHQAAIIVPEPEHVNEYTIRFPAGAAKHINPNKSLVLSITADTDHVKGDFIARNENNEKVAIEPFSLPHGAKQTWVFHREKQIARLTVFVLSGAFTVRIEQYGGDPPESAVNGIVEKAQNLISDGGDESDNEAGAGSVQHADEESKFQNRTEE
ncbi:hypothetical protein ACFL6N_04250 [Thermodesulfobacteriota bacterium]